MKPTIYISSTIYDFEDLRSSLKHVLEELGYSVLLSERNDFRKQIDANSYQSCLGALSQAQYFVLLIGQRVGGLYDAAEGVSITRMEYRRAYELAKEGKLKILSFVRKPLWDIREDRKELEKFLKTQTAELKELDEAKVQEISNHSSTFVNDAEKIFDFIKEVTRADKMKSAIKGAGTFPTANWVHTFTGFSDIMATIQAELNIGTSLGRIAVSANLQHELAVNLSSLLGKHKKGVFANCRFWPGAARKSYNGKADGTSQISGKHLLRLWAYMLGIGKASGLSSQFIFEALSSGEFLRFDQQTASFVPGPIHKALLQLSDNLDRLRRLAEADVLVDRCLTELKEAPADDLPVRVSNKSLLFAFMVQDLEQNIVSLSVGLLKALRGKTVNLDAIPLQAESPSPEMAAELQQENATPEESLEWALAQTEE